MISHHLWRALGESPAIIGRPLTLNGSPATVVGVMPANFAFPSPETDAWVPLSLSAANRANRDGRWLRVIGRLRSNTALRAAQQSMDIVAHRLASEYPKTNAGWTMALIPLQEELVGSTRPILLTLQGGTLLLLLITCANLTNLLMAKAATRTREIGLRAALGASRARILRQLIVETSVLATLGGGLGFLLAIEGVALVRSLGDGLIPRAAEIHIDAGVTLFALAVTLVTALIFGLAPALEASRADLRSSAVRGAGSLAIERKRSLLIMIEVGLASVLLVGSGLLGESLLHLLATPPGVRIDHALTVRLTLARSQYPTNEKQNLFLARLLDDVRALPGVTASGEVSETPLKGNNPTFQFALERPTDAPVQAGARAISPGYLAAAGIPLKEGRDITAHDQPATSPVAIINETMARRYWPGSDALGKRLRFKEDDRWLTVAGIVRDTRHMGLDADEGPVVYFPYAQKTQAWLAWTTLLIRTSAEPMDLVPAIRAAIRAIDRNQPIAEIGTLEESLTRSTAIPRFTTSVIGAASGFALLIAVIGVYGLLAYAVAQRLPELGIRVALGASPAQVSWLLMRQAMLRVLVGIAVGMLAAWWLARLLEKLLFGVRPHDPMTFAAVAALLILTSLAAVLGPARRAMRIDPMTALRAE
ncbi:MAG TPA: ABC transporter permease [Bryobacteraceae bacterium]